MTVFAAAAAVVLLLALQLKLDFHWGAKALAFKQRALNTAKSTLALKQTQQTKEELEQNLNQRGHALTQDDIRELRETIFSETRSSDEISASLQLLAHSDADDAQSTLLDFVLDGPTRSTPEQKNLQLLALDGIIAQTKRGQDTSALEEIRIESHDPEISERASQALAGLSK